MEGDIIRLTKRRLTSTDTTYLALKKPKEPDKSNLNCNTNNLNRLCIIEGNDAKEPERFKQLLLRNGQINN